MELKKHLLPDTELYRSYYTYDEMILEHMKLYKTVRGYTGKVWLDNIVIDIDKGDDTNEGVLYRSQCFVQKLEDDWKLDRNEIQIFFSGRGYHISFPDIFRFEPSPDLPDEVKATLTKYFPEMDAMPLMKPGLIRVPFSYNSKTKLYKTPLSAAEFFSWTPEQIFEVAGRFGPRKVERDTMSNVPDFSSLKIVKKSRRKKEEERGEATKVITCAQTMFDQGAAAQEGERHKILLRLVATWRMRGDSFKSAMALARAWNEGSFADYELEKQVKYNWDKGYTPGCDDEVRVKFCDPKCIHYKQKNLVTEVMDSKTMEETYRDFIKTDFAKTSFDLNEFYKIKGSYRIYPGEMVYFLGETGIGKTALVQNICVRLRRMKILYLSLEVNEKLLFRRFIQIAEGMTKEQVFEHYNNSGESLTEKIDHIQVMTVSPEIKAIEQLIKRHNPQVTVIDTTDGISIDKTFTRGTSDTEKIGIGLKEMANRTNTIIIGIHHITKAAAVNDKGESKELTVHSGKGSSAIEQKSDRMIAIEGSLGTNVRLVRSLKTRDDESFAIQLQFNASTNFRMEQLL